MSELIPEVGDVWEYKIGKSKVSIEELFDVKD